MIIKRVEAAVAEIRIETIANTDAPGAHTTTTDLSSWQQDSQHPVQNRAGVSRDQMTDTTTTTTIEETVDTTIGSHAAMATGSESGVDQT